MSIESDGATLVALRSAIIRCVSGAQGIKSTALVAEVATFIGGHAVDSDLCKMLDTLIAEGDIIEIEYTLPELEYRVKSFLLPKGSKIRSLQNGDASFMFTPDGTPSHVDNKKVAGLEAQVHEAALRLADGTRLIKESAQNLYVAQASLDLREAELVAVNAELRAMEELAEGWRKTANAREVENNRLRRIIQAGDDGVTPE